MEVRYYCDADMGQSCAGL